MFINCAPTCAVVILEQIQPCWWLSLLAVILPEILVQYNSYVNVQPWPRVALYSAGPHMARWHHSSRKNNVTRISSIHPKYFFFFLLWNMQRWQALKRITNFGRNCVQQFQWVLLHRLAFLHSAEKLSSGSQRRKILSCSVFARWSLKIWSCVHFWKLAVIHVSSWGLHFNELL